MATYTVTYDANGGTGTAPATQSGAASYTVSANTFAKDGMIFNTWSLYADSLSSSFNPGDIITPGANITLYAHYAVGNWKNGVAIFYLPVGAWGTLYARSYGDSAYYSVYADNTEFGIYGKKTGDNGATELAASYLASAEGFWFRFTALEDNLILERFSSQPAGAGGVALETLTANNSKELAYGMWYNDTGGGYTNVSFTTLDTVSSDYIVTPVLNDNVVITPGTPQTVAGGQSTTFTIVPNENMVINTVTSTNGDTVTFTAPTSYSITPTSDTSILTTVTAESIWEYNRVREAQSPSIIQVLRGATEVLTEQNIETLDIDENISPTGAEIPVDTADIVCLFDTESIEDDLMSDDAKIKQIYDWYVATFPVGGAITINSGFLLDDEEVLS